MKLITELHKLLKYCKWIARDTKRYTRALFVILLIDAISALAGVAIAIISKNIIDYAVKGEMRKALLYAVVFGTLILTNLGIRAFSSILSTKTMESFSNSMRQRIFSRITMTQWMSVSRYHSGDVLTRLTSDVGAVSTGVVGTLPGIVSLSVQLLAAFGTLLYYEPFLAVLAFVLGPFTVIFSRLWGRKLKKLHVKVQESESAYRSFIQESIENMIIVKTFCLEKQSINNIANLHDNRMKWVIQRNKTSVVAGTVMGLGYWGGYFLAFCWGAMRLSTGSTTFGTLTAFLQLVEQVQGPFIGLSRTLPQIVASMASAGRLMELEALPLEENTGSLPATIAAGICFKKVTFSYSNSLPVLDKLNFNIKPGEIVALVGPSGEGKTTLIRILLALLNPDSGSVCLTDEDGKESMVSAETRNWISYVPQGNTLFSGTIADNIWSGCKEASLEELESAACDAGALEFIRELPDGMNTVIGERGVGLSEGQAQRIAIARAILRKAPILILDEATSALDMDSEMHVLKSIKNMQPSRTCIVITHRPSALNICSRVLKLQEGRLFETAARNSVINREEIA